MTLIELLKQVFNASDEQIASITDGMKTNKIFTTSEENMDIRHGKLKDQHAATAKQLEDANALIEDLKKNNKGNEALQQKVTAYETENEKLKAQLLEAQIDGEVQVKLLSAGVKPDDIDYVMFKLKAKGALEMGEDGKVKGLDEKVDALKTQLPGQFATDGKKVYMENKLPTDSENNNGITRENLLKKPYAERMKIYSENPEAYKAAMGNN